MIEFILLMIVLDILSKIVVGEKECYTEEQKQNNDNKWEFKNLDDCMEFRELRLTGWKGNAEDFYELKAKDEI